MLIWMYEPGSPGKWARTQVSQSGLCEHSKSSISHIISSIENSFSRLKITQEA